MPVRWLRRRPGSSLLGAAVLLLVSGLASSAQAAKVKGRIENWRNLTNPVWNDAKDAKKHGYSFREAVPTVRSEFRVLFPHIPKELCIAAIGTAKQKPVPPVLIRVGGGRTTPVTLVVPPGTQLQFQNTDPFKHRLYGVGISTFAPNDTIKGGVRSWTVAGPTAFEIRDQLAPSLRMWVIGEPNVAAIAYPSMKGEFQLTIAESGEYTIQAYFAGKKVGPAKTVRLDGADIDISKDVIKVAPDKKKEDDKAAKDKKPEEKK
jgi:hypothetical protein